MTCRQAPTKARNIRPIMTHGRRVEQPVEHPADDDPAERIADHRRGDVHRPAAAVDHRLVEPEPLRLRARRAAAAAARASRAADPHRWGPVRSGSFAHAERASRRGHRESAARRAARRGRAALRRGAGASQPGRNEQGRARVRRARPCVHSAAARSGRAAAVAHAAAPPPRVCQLPSGAWYFSPGAVRAISEAARGEGVFLERGVAAPGPSAHRRARRLMLMSSTIARSAGVLRADDAEIAVHLLADLARRRARRHRPGRAAPSAGAAAPAARRRQRAGGRRCDCPDAVLIRISPGSLRSCCPRRPPAGRSLPA